MITRGQTPPSFLHYSKYMRGGVINDFNPLPIKCSLHLIYLRARADKSNLDPKIAKLTLCSFCFYALLILPKPHHLERFFMQCHKLKQREITLFITLQPNETVLK